MAAKLLIDRMRNPAQRNAHEVVPFEIVERESVAEFAPA